MEKPGTIVASIVYTELRRGALAARRVRNLIDARVRELEAADAPMETVREELGRLTVYNQAVDELEWLKTKAERKLLRACVDAEHRRRSEIANRSKAAPVA